MGLGTQVGRRSLLVMSLVLLSSGTGLNAQPAPVLPDLKEEQDWQAVCKAALTQPLPAAAAALADAPAHSSAAPSGCDETDAYYGFAKPPDYRSALRCAYLHRVAPSGSFIEGSSTLTMLYANGFGVARDYDLAIRFACEAAGNSASEESALRIGQLEALRDGRLPRDRPFDLCDDATSGAMGSYCEDIHQRIADVDRGNRLRKLLARLPERAQAQLPELQAAETAFEKARGQGEDTGGGGSGAGGFRLLDQGQLREQFLINLQRFAAGELPSATAADRARAEQQLKTAAHLAQNFTPDPDAFARASVAPTPESLAATQQAWEALFAAWMRFVPVAYPQLSLDTAATELLRLRLHQLKRVLPPH